jgi:hypothetical protein
VVGKSGYTVASGRVLSWLSDIKAGFGKDLVATPNEFIDLTINNWAAENVPWQTWRPYRA